MENARWTSQSEAQISHYCRGYHGPINCQNKSEQPPFKYIGIYDCFGIGNKLIERRNYNLCFNIFNCINAS